MVDLQLTQAEVPSLSTICKCLQNLNITRKKIIKVPMERFTVDNIQRRKLFIEWRNSVNPADVYFIDETRFYISSDEREHGRSLTNHPVPIVMEKSRSTDKWSVFS